MGLSAPRSGDGGATQGNPGRSSASTSPARPAQVMLHRAITLPDPTHNHAVHQRAEFRTALMQGDVCAAVGAGDLACLSITACAQADLRAVEWPWGRRGHMHKGLPRVVQTRSALHHHLSRKARCVRVILRRPGSRICHPCSSFGHLIVSPCWMSPSNLRQTSLSCTFQSSMDVATVARDAATMACSRERERAAGCTPMQLGNIL